MHITFNEHFYDVSGNNYHLERSPGGTLKYNYDTGAPLTRWNMDMMYIKMELVTEYKYLILRLIFPQNFPWQVTKEKLVSGNATFHNRAN